MEGKGVRNKRPWGHLWSFVDSVRKRIRGESETAPENLTAARSLEGKDSDLQVVNMAASSSSSHEKYEVFLSFRGEDTRDGFIGHLYNALCQKHINTYKDDENLESGHKIAEIMDAIEESMICLIVFSKDFASSTWCLDEVFRILECKRRGNDIIPIFYGIEPSIVRKQEQSYAVSFGKHEQRFKDKMDKVQRWRDALNEVAALSGYDSKNKRPEYEFIDEIVKDILSKLSRYSSTCDHSKRGLIGIENRIREIEGLLCIDSMDVRTIGLYGMGGNGKTTLARVVFEKFSHHFRSRCFLLNVREEYEKHGIMELRKQLHSQLFCYDKTILSLESTHLQERLCRTKVLIVLDDLDDVISQLNELLPKGYRFCAGSRIIVTTRDAQLLKPMTDKVYEVKRLNYAEAFRLFCLHAFGNNCALEGYEALSKSVADYAGGNPLALEVLGSSLHSKSVEVWKSALDELQTEPNRRIEEVLRISFDQLGKKGKKGFTPIQDVFLDVACLYDNGVDRKSVESIIHHSGATKKISDLIDKCLIIEDDNRLSMHSLIRQMGQAIVFDMSKEPGNRSRLWKAEDVLHVLEGNTGSCKIEGILLDQSKLPKAVKVRRTAFSKMCHLRILKIYGKYYTRAPEGKMYLPSKGIEYLSEKLRYLQWDLYPSKYLPSNFSPESLVELVIRGSQLVELPWNEGQPLGSLKKIDLTDCEALTPMQNLCAATNLKWINLLGCSSLVQVPSGFKNLKKLEHLDLSSCKKLKDGLENLPLNIVWLSLSGTAIEALPSEFQRLSNCKHLYLDHCKKLEYIQNISSSMGITELDLDQTAIKTLPKSIWKMRCLKYLYLTDCPNLEKLPEMLDDCMSSSLEVLDIMGCTGLKSIPESIWSLRKLTLRDCPNLEKVPEISDDCMSSSLEELDIMGCTGLKSIPESIWSLRKLTLWDCPNLEKVSEISDDCMSSSLEELDIMGCTGLKSIPESIWKISSLRTLTLRDCPNLEKVPEISGSSLEELDIMGCTGLKSIPESIWKISSLRKLTLSDYPNLEMVPEISDDCMSSSLEELDIMGCTGLKSIPESIWSLRKLTLWDCPNLEKVPEISDDCMSSSLEELDIMGCTGLKSIPESIWKISSLRTLTLRDCPNLEKVPEISGSSLEELDIMGCTGLKSIPESIWKISSLRKLTLSDCPNLEMVPEISDDCMSGLDISLEWMNMEGCTRLVKVPKWFKNLNKLGHLDLGGCKNLKDGLENLPLNIRVLSLYGTAIEALPSSFRDLEELLYLVMGHCKNLTDGIENLPLNIRALRLNGCTRLKSIPGLPSGVVFLDAINCTSLETMSSWSVGNRQAVYPGNEIPEWFSHQTDDGNSPHFHLPPNWFPVHDPLFGFLFSVVFRVNGYVTPGELFLDINFKTNVNSDDSRHRRYQISKGDRGLESYQCEMERDHVYIAGVELDLEELFGEEWSSVCFNVTEVSFCVSINEDGRDIDCQIKKFGLGLAK